MKRLALLLLLMVLLNWSCQDFSFDERLKLPVVEMLPVSVDQDGATFTSVIHDIGSNFIVRAYFNWYPKGREFFIEDELYREDVVLNDQKEVTEYGATAIAALLLQKLTHYEILGRAEQEEGIDYYIGSR
ncbi:MAG: hypothetical protein AAFO02_24960, partial [Bacteroidota bacterium]